MADPTPGTTVIGLGNPLMSDDGLGLRVCERLLATWIIPPDVEVMDGGTWGMNLLPAIEDAASLLLVDAIDRGLAPGTPIILTREEIPRALALKVSPHQIDLREVLALAQLRGTLPERLTMIGAQPERVELGEGLSTSVEAQLDAVVASALAQLREWGHVCAPREAAAHA
jgi:hydrogenase maturation protease